ncbi:MAG TPA: hypothetical protein VH393_10725 [Ktedonobacterales bacterium]
MVASIPSFRDLYHQIRAYQRRAEHEHVYEEVLLPWQNQALEALSVLQVYGALEAWTWTSDQPDPCNGGDSSYYSCRECLYAFSRISDLLLLPQQHVWDFLHPPLPHWAPESVANHLGWMSDQGFPPPTPSISLEERNAWLRGLGLTEIEHPTFHPFYHEIVEVEQAPDPDEPIQLLQTLWPGFFLGQMLFCRAGVRVRAGERVAHKDLAEHSRLYWAFWRNNRPAVDRSHGWGHNSQWSTDFRRDYVDDEAYYYNVDGEEDIHEEWTGSPGEPNDHGDPRLTLPMRIELLTNRCFIRTPERFFSEGFDNVTYQEPKEATLDAGA